MFDIDINVADRADHSHRFVLSPAGVRVSREPIGGLYTTIEPRAIPGQVQMQPVVRPISAGVPFAVSLNSLSLSLSRRRGDSEFKETANVRIGDALQETNID